MSLIFGILDPISWIMNGVFVLAIMYPLSILQTFFIYIFPYLTGAELPKLFVKNFSWDTPLFKTIFFIIFSFIALITVLKIIIWKIELNDNRAKLVLFIKGFWSFTIFLILTPSVFLLLSAILLSVNEILFGNSFADKSSIANALYRSGYINPPEGSPDFTTIPEWTNYNYIIPIVGTLAFAYIVYKLSNVLIGRIIKITFLFTISPFIGISFLTDYGQRFLSWKSQVISNFCSSLIIQFVWLIFLSAFQIIADQRIFDNILADSLLTVLFAGAGVSVIPNIITYSEGLFNAGSETFTNQIQAVTSRATETAKNWWKAK